MRILIISDTHGEIPIESCKELDLEFDACVSLGDVDQEMLRYWEGQCRERAVPMFALVGNHDTWQWLDGFDYLVNVHNQRFELGDYSCFGFGGSYDYSHMSPAEKLTWPVMDDEESRILEDAPAVDILFTHDSAKFDLVVDESLIAWVTSLIPHVGNHPGLLGISNYVLKNAPKYAISGHHHINLQFRYKDTTVISVYGLSVVDLDTGNLENVLNQGDPLVKMGAHLDLSSILSGLGE